MEQISYLNKDRDHIPTLECGGERPGNRRECLWLAVVRHSNVIEPCPEYNHVQ
jgi:hypothetical protein